MQGKQASILSPLVAYAKGTRKEWRPIYLRMEEHVVVYRYVSAAKGKSKVKRPRQLEDAEDGDKLEHLRSELDSLTSLLPLDESEEPDENLSAELDRLPSPQPAQEPKELEEPEEAKDLEEAKAEHAEPKEAEEAETHAEPKVAEEAKEQEESRESARSLDGLRESKTVEAWCGDLWRHLTTVSRLPQVTNSTFCDAKKLFDVNRDSKVTLRNTVGGNEDIVLLQFDPNFMSTEVVCRHPSRCNNKNPAATERGKRDLYLCPHHQQVLKNNISEAFAEKSVEISTSVEKPEPGHFAGYTSLISLLEGAFHDSKKFRTPQGKSPMLQEAILNVRNFLIITSTVLNPDEDNLGIALPPVVQILKLILENRKDIECFLDKAISLLKDVIAIILSAFGVIYTWVSLALGNPGAQIGAGLGGLIGGCSSLATGPLGLLGGVAVGGTLGGLIGNGIYNLLWGQRQQETYGLGPNRKPHNQYPKYHFHGDVTGGLYLHLEFH